MKTHALPRLLALTLLLSLPLHAVAENNDTTATNPKPPKIKINLGHALDSLEGEDTAVAPQPGQSVQQLQQRYNSLAQERVEQDQTLWSKERLAQEYEEAFIKLWDDLRLSGHKPGTFADFEFESLTFGLPGVTEPVIEGVTRAGMHQAPKTIDHAQWRTLTDSLFDLGYRVKQSEWHHASFDMDDQGNAHSQVSMTIDLTHPGQGERLTLKGIIKVDWSGRRNSTGQHMPGSIDATGLTLYRRAGEVMFEHKVLGKVPFGIGHDDILAHDLDGDGLIDLVYPNSNEVFWNKGDGEFSRKPLCEYPIKVIAEAAIADFTGDGVSDYLVAGANHTGPGAPKRYGLFLYQRDEQGGFSNPATITINPDLAPLTLPSGMAVGDIDNDGDLDLWASQYRPAYSKGNFPTPYYDANDGYPGHLLTNNGDGTFANATEGSGLEHKRYRRAFRASFVDLDEDNDLDLLVVSDFAGADLFYNDGNGQFTDETHNAVDVATNFGMGVALSDFNSDGRLDFYVTGMASTTARRLSKMGLKHPQLEDHNDQRLVIAYGNRMYLRQSPGRYIEPAFRDQVARSGWSWGVASGDFNNDGYPDIYVCNGNKSGLSAKDYCTRFWCHDIYSGSSDEDPAQYKLFMDELGEFSKDGMSWNGFEHNHLFMNQQATGFTNTGFLMGVGFEQDSRAAIAHDFDNDGRVDLLLTTRNSFTDGENYEVHLLRNRADVKGRHWVGVRLRGGPGVSPIGAVVTARYRNGSQRDAVLTGDSYSAQHADVVHFGLGEIDRLDAIEVQWPNGSTTTLNAPDVDTYHDLRPEEQATAKVRP